MSRQLNSMLDRSLRRAGGRAPGVHSRATRAEAVGVLRAVRATGARVLVRRYGGGVAWRVLTQEPRLSAGVPFYGPTPDLAAVPGIQAPVLAVYGGSLWFFLRHKWISAFIWVACLYGTYHFLTVLPDLVQDIVDGRDRRHELGER